MMSGGGPGGYASQGRDDDGPGGRLVVVVGGGWGEGAHEAANLGDHVVYRDVAGVLRVDPAAAPGPRTLISATPAAAPRARARERVVKRAPLAPRAEGSLGGNRNASLGGVGP